MQNLVARLGLGTLRVDVARTPEELATGLSRRAHLDENSGMMFDIGAVTTTPFTLRDTAVPLDVMFLDEAMRVLAIRTVSAYDPRPVAPPGPYRYALETRARWAERHGVMVGSRLVPLAA